MEENSAASESDASPIDPSDPDHFLSREPAGARPVAVGPSGTCSSPADQTRTGATSRRLGRSKLFCLGLILTGLDALAPESFALAEGAGLEHVRSSGKLRYGSDMEGGGPYAYPDPKSPRDVTGFEVELMAMLACSGDTIPISGPGMFRGKACSGDMFPGTCSGDTIPISGPARRHVPACSGDTIPISGPARVWAWPP